jgi:glycosyltransferase involved in cell wall biosynthesis
LSTQPQGDNPASTPVFSIFVPSYKPAPFFETAMHSALDQVDLDDEPLIQDADSADGTQEIIAEVRADQRVKRVIEPDHGQADAFNRALARANPRRRSG